jgi:hypothetical protein
MRADDAAPTTFESLKKRAVDLAPTIPAIKVPSIPDFEVPDFSKMKDSLMGEFAEFTGQVAATLPTLEAMGYEVTTFRVQWAVPPKAKLRLKSKTLTDPAKVEAAVAGAPKGVIASAMVSSAASAKNIQAAMKMGTVIIDIDFAVPPKVRMSFMPTKTDTPENGRAIEDMDLACSQAFADK